MFIAALFTAPKLLNQLRCLSMDQFYSAAEKNKTMLFTGKQNKKMEAGLRRKEQNAKASLDSGSLVVEIKSESSCKESDRQLTTYMTHY